jgi:hypothetical protein
VNLSEKNDFSNFLTSEQIRFSNFLSALQHINTEKDFKSIMEIAMECNIPEIQVSCCYPFLSKFELSQLVDLQTIALEFF